MGQKVNPVGMRVGINREWDSQWYADKDFSKFLNEDITIRKYLEKTFKREALMSRVVIRRVKENEIMLVLHAAKPGVILGQEGKGVEAVSKHISHITNGKKVTIKVEEIKNPDLDATIVAETIAMQLEARASFRNAQKQAIKRVMKAGAKGIKTSVSGRLGGADIARAEGYSEGITPLHTLRSDIDFAIAEAATTYGKLGVKVWICRGEILPTRVNAVATEAEKGE